MKSNKTIDLIKALPESDIKKIKHILNTNSRTKSLYKLFCIICNNLSITKEVIYRKLYNNTYTKDKDYLLRNELRSLNKKIESYIIEKEFHNDIRNNLNIHNYYILKGMQDMKLYSLFSNKIKSSLESAISDFDYITAYSITSLQINNFTHHLIPTKDNLARTEETLRMQIAFLSAFYINSMYKSNIELLNISDNNVDNIQQNIEETLENKYRKYLAKKSELFYNKADNHIEIINDCINILNTIDSNNSDIEKERIFCKLSLAHEYTHIRKFDEANAIYKTLIEADVINDNVTKCTLILDYASNLIRTEDYDIAMQLLETNNPTDIYNTPAIELKSKYMHAIINAFLFNNEDINNHITSCNTLCNYDKYSWRLLFAIETYLNKDYTNGHRECLNIKNSIRYKSTGIDIRDIINFYIRFFNLMESSLHKEKEINGSMIRLENDMNIFINNAEPEITEYLPLIWLFRTVKNHIAQ